MSIIQRLWRHQPGKYFCLSTKDRKGEWEDHFFSVGEIGKIPKFLKENHDKNLYFCPHGFNKRRRLKKYAVLPKLLYADLDETNPVTLPVKPTVAIESSPGRFVGLWLVDQEINEDLNKGLTYLCKADPGGWDLTQVLRVPNTINYKYESMPKVRLRWSDGPEYSLDEIRKRIPVEDVKHKEVVNDVYAIFKKYEKQLTPFARRELLKGRPERGKRSEVFWRLSQEVIEAGMDSDEAYLILKASPWNKFAGRSSERTQLKREIKKAVTNHITKGSKRQTYIEPGEDEEKESYKFLSRSLEEVEIEKLDWIWYPYLARGELTILEGDPGLGKSYLAQIVSMYIADGKPLPSVKMIKPIQGKIAYFDIENSSGTVTKRRLTDNGCKNFKNFFQEEEAFSIRDEDTIDRVYDAIEYLRPTLVVFDTLNTYVGKTDTHNGADSQQAFRHFRDIAKRFDCSVLVLRHLTKSSKERALYRGQGSISFTGLARVVMTVGTMPEEPDVKAMAITKINVTKAPPTLTFTINSLPDTLQAQDRSRFEWGEWVNISSDEIVMSRPIEPKQGDTVREARQFLWEVLGEEGLELAQIRQAADARAVSLRTVYRAAEELGVIKRRTGFGKKKRTLWILPPSAKDEKKD